MNATTGLNTAQEFLWCEEAEEKEKSDEGVVRVGVKVRAYSPVEILFFSDFCSFNS